MQGEVVVLLVTGGLCVASGVWFYLRAKRWRDMVLATGERYRLRCIAPPGIFGLTHSAASGDIEGVDIDVRVDEKSSGGFSNDRDIKYFVLRGRSSVDPRLALRDPKQKTPAQLSGLVDFSARQQPSATPVGDDEIDRCFNVVDASPAVLDALRSGDLRRRVLELARWGLVVEGGRVTLRTRRFPRTTDELWALVDGVVSVTRELASLQKS